jgi:hypothetical protein
MFEGGYVFKCAPRDRVECTRVILAIGATYENDGEKDNQGERAEFVGAAPASGCVNRTRVETSTGWFDRDGQCRVADDPGRADASNLSRHRDDRGCVVV